MPSTRGWRRGSAAALALAAALLFAACGKSDPRTEAATAGTESTTSASPASSCVNGAFPATAMGSPPGFKINGTGNTPGWYVWFAGPYLRVRLVSDPAKPLAPPPTTEAPREGKGAATTTPVILSYTGQLEASAPVGKATLVPDATAGLVDVSGAKVTFAVNGKATPVGFDLAVPCRVKQVQLQLDIPTNEGPKPIGVDQVFVGAHSHPVENPMVFARVADPNAPATTKPKTTPTTKAPTSTTAPGMGGAKASTTTTAEP